MTKLMKKDSLKKFSEPLLYILIVIGFVFLIPKALSFVLKTPYPIAAISSSSMWPTLKAGDLILIEGVKKENLKIGDIVVYQNMKQGKGFTVHRVIKINDQNFITRGDANAVSDKPVKYNKLIGRVVYLGNHPFRMPYLGRITMLIH